MSSLGPFLRLFLTDVNSLHFCFDHIYLWSLNHFIYVVVSWAILTKSLTLPSQWIRKLHKKKNDHTFFYELIVQCVFPHYLKPKNIKQEQLLV